MKKQLLTLFLAFTALFSAAAQSVEANLVDAVQMYSDGNIKQARELLKTLSVVAPGNDAVWYYLSMTQTVSNELDVVCTQGVLPVFISCKTCDARTEALNELAILRDRFGGKGSRAIIVTSAPAARGRAVMRHRAAELGIEVIEWNDLALDRLISRLRRERESD